MIKKKKILHLEKEAYSSDSLNDLEKKYSVTYKNFDEQKSLDKYLLDNHFDIIFTKLGLYLGEEQLRNQKILKAICTPTTGYNHINITKEALNSIKIIGLKNQTSFLKNVKSTAEHTWALTLAISRNITNAVRYTKENNSWDREPFLAKELNNKTLGIIGYGRLGKIVAEYGLVFGMNVLINDINQNKYSSKPKEVNAVGIEFLLKHSDYIILLISWKNDNEKFINSEKMQKMKDGVIFINTSRGEFVDEDMLLENLKKGKISGAALDVLNGDSSWSKNENIYNQLLEYSKENDNLIITPHMGGYGSSSIKTTRNYLTKLFLNQSI